MDKKKLQEILSNTFSIEDWKTVLIDVFSVRNLKQLPQQIPLPINDKADAAYELGTFNTTDDRIIGLYHVKVKPAVWLERNKVGLRELLRSVYKYDVDGALIVFEQGDKWRLSFVSEIRSFDEEGSITKIITEPKRYTYLLGKDEISRTAVERLFSISNKSLNLEDIRNAFSVEALTKEFYSELSNWYFCALQNVKFPADFEADEEVRNATSTIRLITRLMFVWFLKEKNLIPNELFDEKELKQILNFTDKTGSTFYKAILQNLFFATLNTEMTDDKRKFVHRQYGVQGFYRYERFFNNKERFLELTRNIPFLNGGLFENLDKNVGEENEIRIDCFSNKVANETRLSIPDYLFFGGAEHADLNRAYGDNTHGNLKVRGLIEILKSYNFTIEENTPYEIEVALDPELLGKVFENLLASYNPETKTTARKQTGSFYTPREIVNYMVDESILAYLKNKLLDDSGGTVSIGNPQIEFFGNESRKDQLTLEQKVNYSKWTGNEKSLEENLRLLLLFNGHENPFDSKDTLQLIKAIDNCKILDPACGSGAFPMGVLQKLVQILQKLDKNNQIWRELQKQKAIAETENAYSIGDKEERQKRLIDIDETFDYNASDYGRKLYIIENSIYGVDIQPIAVQIAKLRFFISLVCDQKSDKNRENLGIRPLPNLETKFVAANTLLGFNKPQQLFLRNPEIQKLEKLLSVVRHEHFRARTPLTKEKRRIEDKQIREKIGQLLIISGWSDQTAQMLANWNPYDQNNSAPFFDGEWMFGMLKGFSIIIGNPPFVRADNPAIASQRNIILNSKQYETLWEKWDLMIPFFERGIKLLEPSGILTFLASNSITTSKYAEKLQDWIIKNHFVRSIDYFENVEVFEAGVIPVILSLQAQRKENYTKKTYRTNNFDNIEVIMLDNETESLKSKVFRKSFSDIFKPNISTERLGDICYISKGMVPNSDEKVSKGVFGKDDLISDYEDSIHCKKYIEGKDLNAFKIDKIRYFEFFTSRVPSQLSRPTFEGLYIGDKLLRGCVTKGTYDNTGIICNHSITVFKRFCDLKNVEERSISVSISKNNFETHGSKTSIQVNKRRLELEILSENYNLKYILAVINSSYAMAYLNNYRRHRLENYFYPDDFRNYPLPKFELSKQDAFDSLTDYMLFLRNIKSPQVLEAVPNEHIAQFIETVINGCVFELYFPEHMKEKEIDILQFVEIEIQPIIGKTAIEKALTIRNTYEKWREYKSQVRNRLLLFGSRSQDIIMKIENGK